MIRTRKASPSKLRREKELLFKMNSYTTLRKNREKFRRNLVEMIIAQELEDNPASEINEEKVMSAGVKDDLLKYYYYIMHGIDDVHVAPIEPKLLEKILNLVPRERKKKFKSILNKVIDEIKEDYAMGLKKSIVDFVLQDPLKDDYGVYESKVRIFFIFYNNKL